MTNDRADIRHSVLGVFGTTVAVGLWGFGNVLVRIIPMSGLVISFQRLWLGSATALLVMFISGRRIGWIDIRRSILGGVAFGLNVVFFFSAVKYTSPTTATVIETLQPVILIMVVGKFFGERVRLAATLASLVALVGTVAVVLGAPTKGHDSLFGDFLAVVALLSYSAYFVASKKAREHVGTIEYQVAIQVVAAILVTPIIVFTGTGFNGDLHNWSLVAILSVVVGSGHYLVNWSHSHTSLSLLSALTLLTPVFTMVASYLMLGETVSPIQVAGTIVMIGALTFVVLRTPIAVGRLTEI